MSNRLIKDSDLEDLRSIVKWIKKYESTENSKLGPIDRLGRFIIDKLSGRGAKINNIFSFLKKKELRENQIVQIVSNFNESASYVKQLPFFSHLLGKVDSQTVSQSVLSKLQRGNVEGAYTEVILAIGSDSSKEEQVFTVLVYLLAEGGDQLARCIMCDVYTKEPKHLAYEIFREAYELMYKCAEIDSRKMPKEVIIDFIKIDRTNGKLVDAFQDAKRVIKKGVDSLKERNFNDKTLQGKLECLGKSEVATEDDALLAVFEHIAPQVLQCLQKGHITHALKIINSILPGNSGADDLMPAIVTLLLTSRGAELNEVINQLSMVNWPTTSEFAYALTSFQVAQAFVKTVAS